MIRIAFCDDDLSVLNQLSDLLEQYCEERSLPIEHKTFQSSLDLLAELDRGVRYDILFLDVLMPGENGIDTAAEIRTFDKQVKIIFLSSSSEYAVQSYTVGAYYYQMKPIRKESVFPLLDSVLSACEKEQKISLLLQCKKGMTRVELNQLEYCEVIHRTLFFHLSSGEVLESSGNMEELSNKLLPYGCFLRAHRSYLVNLDYVKTLTYHTITMYSQAEIPIPRGKYNGIKNAYLEYAFQNSQVMV